MSKENKRIKQFSRNIFTLLHKGRKVFHFFPENKGWKYNKGDTFFKIIHPLWKCNVLYFPQMSIHGSRTMTKPQTEKAYYIISLSWIECYVEKEKLTFYFLLFIMAFSPLLLKLQHIKRKFVSILQLWKVVVCCLLYLESKYKSSGFDRTTELRQQCIHKHIYTCIQCSSAKAVWKLEYIIQVPITSFILRWENIF